MPDTIIEIDELTKIYNGFKAVDGISLEIKRGRFSGFWTQWCREDDDYPDAPGPDRAHFRQCKDNGP